MHNQKNYRTRRWVGLVQRPGNIAKCLTVTMVALIGIINGIALPRVTPSTIVVEASESSSDEWSRAGGRRISDGRSRSVATEASGSPVSALSQTDDSVTRTSAQATNGKIAFAREVSISEVYVVNADGSNQKALTDTQGFDGSAVWSPDGSRIAFESGRDGNARTRIYVMNADGSNQTRLTDSPAGAPAWSPDGSRIAFTGQGDNDSGIYVMNADGSNQTRLTSSPAGAPVWSPDGSRIAFMHFQSDNDDNTQIFVINADGSNQRQLTHDSAYKGSFVWSPDGSRIAFTQSTPDFLVFSNEIFVISVDGGSQTRLTSFIGNNYDPAWSPDGGKIAFTNETYDYYSIFVMNADGSGQTKLTNNSQAFEGAPVWSPDGARIAFNRGSDLYVMNADASGQTAVTNNPYGAYVYGQRWSPDGVRILFEYHLNIDDEIYVMNGDGSGLLNLTNNPAIDRHPAWSPDGTKIAFESYRDFGSINIYVMNSDGSGQTRLTSLPGFNIDPDWSPDGTRIVFAHDHNGNTAIYVMNADGSNLRQLANPGTLYGSPSWSPDGSRIAFASYQNGNQEIYVMNADGSSQMNLTNSPGFDARPAWSPDGTKIVFEQLHNPNTDIYVMNADGSNQTRLTDNNPGFDGEPIWSPDGSRIAFASNRDGNAEIYVMNPDGSNPTRLTHNLDAYNLDPDWQPLSATPTPTPTPTPTATPTPTPTPTQTPPANGKIAFVSPRDGNPEIYSVNPDGTGTLRLTFNAGDDDYPDWSPDGTKIAYLSESSLGQRAIKVMNADGSGQRIVTPVVFDLTTRNFCHERFSLGWSPDGSKIVFQEFGHIVSVNVDGSNRQNITSTAVRESEPSWARTGLIAYASTLAHGADDVNGLEIRTTDGKYYAYYGYYTCSTSPALSPDGTKLAYVHSNDYPPPGYILITPVNLNSFDERTFYNFTNVRNVRWSPDGNFLAFTTCAYPGPCSVRIEDEFGQGSRVLTEGTNPSWQGLPSGTVCPNPIDCAESFVRQHYLDFLNREPDAGGLAY